MLKTLENNTVLNKIIDSIKELKGMDIVLLDLRKKLKMQSVNFL